MKVDGEKIRLQLWDQGQCKDPEATFNPLFSRHAAGCIIVCNSLNLKSVKAATMWKEAFHKTTQVPGEAAFPCCLFINHHDSVPHDD